MEKKLTRAEELALKAYPISPSCLSESNGDGDRNYPRRLAFIEGYRQAEKDLGWISVKDRLPEIGHFVLTCVDDSGTPQSVGMALLLKDGTWWDGDMKVCVDYWMEVPKFNK